MLLPLKAKENMSCKINFSTTIIANMQSEQPQIVEDQRLKHYGMETWSMSINPELSQRSAHNSQSFFKDLSQKSIAVALDGETKLEEVPLPIKDNFKSVSG